MNTERTAQPGMLCPTCKVPLLMGDRQNIEIDFCPRCHGVWLNGSDLDNLIELSFSSDRARARRSAHIRTGKYVADSHDRKHVDYGHPGGRRKSWLRKIFD